MLKNEILKNADPQGVDLSHADLTGACLTGANINNAYFKVCGRWAISKTTGGYGLDARLSLIGMIFLLELRCLKPLGAHLSFLKSSIITDGLFSF